MDSTWYVGNTDDDASENRSWVVGHFKQPGDVRHSKDVEVKWAHHPQGDARIEWAPGVHAGTVLILVSGRWRLNLRTKRHGRNDPDGAARRLRRLGSWGRPHSAGPS